MALCTYYAFQASVHGVTRFAILRWCLSEDDDEALALRSRGNLQSHRACNFCRSECKVYPFGLHREPVCDACCLLQHINAFTLGRSHVTSFCYRAAITASPIGLASVLCRYWCLIIFVLKHTCTLILHKRSMLTTMSLLWHQLCCTNSVDFYLNVGGWYIRKRREIL